MKRLSRLALSLLVLLPLVAAAQIAAPRKPTDTRPVTTPMPAQPAARPADALSAPPQPIRAPTQGMQPLPTHPIQSQGPARVVPPAPPATTAPVKVYDRNGRIVPGMQQAGPNRVLDTRTGRYYDSVPAGDGQSIRP
ncbi:MULTISPECIES: hypothetical protein [Stenotrophomonas]|uniref:hypothetical protein n=1 Tax=Stenotrophomonas TaxID=40323 RepID=UPI000871F6E3|nr:MULTISPECIES: hypothetical protein [Stenotrophomonas]OEY98902.1 hypothetical protein BIY45_19880 [Stenotrophomonas sp. BIIR7]